MFHQLGDGQGVRLQTRIIDVDLKNNAGGDCSRFDFSRELLRSAEQDPAVDGLPAGPIAPPKLPNFLPIPAFGFYEASVLHAAPFCTRGAISSAARYYLSPAACAILPKFTLIDSECVLPCSGNTRALGRQFVDDPCFRT
jgi:hypothetical protein